MNPVKTYITPQVAQAILARNHGNRKPREGLITAMVYAMKNGQWLDNGDPIHVATNGRLLNGQHRLMAVQRAGFSYHGVVVYGVDEAAFITYDRHAKRSMSDSTGANSKAIEIYNIIIRSQAVATSPKIVLDFESYPVGEYCKVLNETSNTSRKIYSRASVRAGFVLVALQQGNYNAFIQYKHLVLQEYDSMTTGIKLLSARCNSGNFCPGGAQEQMIECATVISALTSERITSLLRTPKNPFTYIRSYVAELVARGMIPRIA